MITAGGITPRPTVVSVIDRSLTEVPPAQVVAAHAVPLLIVDRVLDDSLVDQLIDVARDQWFPSPMLRPDAAGNPTLVVDRVAKARLDHRLIDERLTGNVQRAMVDNLLPMVAMSFAHPPSAHEAFKIVRYDAGAGWFGPHRDNVTPDAAHRRFAVTINLDEGYEGGCLRFPEFGPTAYRPARGSAIVFSCGLLHEVTPVTLGTRHALITFLW